MLEPLSHTLQPFKCFRFELKVTKCWCWLFLVCESQFLYFQKTWEWVDITLVAQIWLWSNYSLQWDSEHHSRGSWYHQRGVQGLPTLLLGFNCWLDLAGNLNVGLSRPSLACGHVCREYCSDWRPSLLSVAPRPRQRGLNNIREVKASWEKARIHVFILFATDCRDYVLSSYLSVTKIMDCDLKL